MLARSSASRYFGLRDQPLGACLHPANDKKAPMARVSPYYNPRRPIMLSLTRRRAYSPSGVTRRRIKSPSNYSPPRESIIGFGLFEIIERIEGPSDEMLVAYAQCEHGLHARSVWCCAAGWIVRCIYLRRVWARKLGHSSAFHGGPVLSAPSLAGGGEGDLGPSQPPC